MRCRQGRWRSGSASAGGESRGVLRLLRTALGGAWTEPLPIWCWVIEHPEGVIVVDTGVNARMLEPGYFTRWNPYFQHNVRVSVYPEEEIGPRLLGLGIAPEEVRWVVLTHLHLDHDGGLHRDGAFGEGGGIPAAALAVLVRPTPSGAELGAVRSLPAQPCLHSGRRRAAGGNGGTQPWARVGRGLGGGMLAVPRGRYVLHAGADARAGRRRSLAERADSPVNPGASLALRGEGTTVYLPSHDPGSAVRLAIRAPVQMEARVYKEEPNA